ncbi:MAG: leucine-rich repeat domain-containing protein [Cyanobacteria bacterium J06623_4]
MTFFKLSQTLRIRTTFVLLLALTVTACGNKASARRSAESTATTDSYSQEEVDSTLHTEQDHTPVRPDSFQAPAPVSESVASAPTFTAPLTQGSTQDSTNSPSNGATFDPFSDWDVSPQPPDADISPQNAFLTVCEGSAARGWETSDALLAAMGTEDCAIASKRLSKITELQIHKPAEETLSPTTLAVNLPISVDLEIIASAMPNLTKLTLTGRVIEDLSPVAKLTQLSELHISNTQTKNISPISGLVQLKRLDISYNQVNTIAPIAQLTQLKSINISHNPISDIGPLSVLYAPPRALEMIDLSHIQLDRTTCPPQLGDACEDPRIGYEEGLRSLPN